VFAAALLLIVAAAVRGEDEEKKAAIKLPAEEVRAVRKAGPKQEAQAKEKWDGKVVEFEALRWASYQEQKDGDHAGQTLISFDVGEVAAKMRTGNTIPVYFTDELDILFVKNVKAFNQTPFTVRGKAVVDFRKWHIHLEDGRIVRDEKEREAAAREVRDWLRAVREQEKTEDGKAYRLSAAAVVGMLSHAKKVEEAATETWNGKVAEVTAVSWASHQDQTMGDHAGQTLFSFDPTEAVTGKRGDKTLAVYFRDATDIATLKARRLGDKAPFKVRGKLVVDYTRGFHVWMEDARLVKD
jgi:hypothetical protein